MKLLLISESVGGGLRKHIVQLIENLDQEEFDIYFIHGTKTLDDAFVSQYENLGKKVKLISCDSFERELNLKQDIETYRFVSKKIHQIRPDIVHCHSSKAGVIGRLAAKRHGIKSVFYTPHAYSFLSPEFGRKKKKIFIGIEKLMSKFATTKTFCVSNGEKNAALDNSLDKSDKLEVIYNGLPGIELPAKEETKVRLGLRKENFVIGNNARMSAQKNPKLFMEIARELINIDKNYHFVWAGDGPLMNKAIEFVRTNNLENNIHLLGDRNDSEIIVAGYDIFLITSLYEGLPYAPIEAMRAGVPILATNVVGNNEIVTEGINGYFIEEKIDKNLVRKVEKAKLLSDYSVRAQFTKEFSLEKMISSIKANYSYRN